MFFISNPDFYKIVRQAWAYMYPEISGIYNEEVIVRLVGDLLCNWHSKIRKMALALVCNAAGWGMGITFEQIQEDLKQFVGPNGQCHFLYHNPNSPTSKSSCETSIILSFFAEHLSIIQYADPSLEGFPTRALAMCMMAVNCAISLYKNPEVAMIFAQGSILLKGDKSKLYKFSHHNWAKTCMKHVLHVKQMPLSQQNLLYELTRPYMRLAKGVEPNNSNPGDESDVDPIVFSKAEV
ncbi:hypothetical protein AX16_002173 [Volvariella volvacea WC 439]|nr:hypothetical protein AX16_002173 [Volvariella volvacea WC 439]